MRAPAIPALFDRVPAALFSPLASPHASIYWDVLARFYQFEFEREPLFLVRETALGLAEQALRESSAFAERREELLALDGDLGAAPAPMDEPALVRAAAARLLFRLERAGWYQFEYRSAVGHVLAFHPYAARLLDTLVRVARDEQPLFQGFAHSIAALLKPESVGARPGVALREAKRHTLGMMRELKILERNIYSFTRRLLDQAASAAEILEEGLERYRGAVMANYHRLKTVDNLYKWRGDILVRLDAVERDPLVLGGAARWYAEQDGIDLAAAAAGVADDLGLLRAEFEALPRIIDDIDMRNARFSGVALRKLMYLVRHDKRMEGQLQLLVDRLARDRAPELLLDAYVCELLGDGFLYTAPRRRARPERQPLARKARRDVDELRQDLAPRLKRPFSRPRVDGFVANWLAGRAHVAMTEFPLASDEDYVRAIYLCAFGLDGASPFRFERIASTADAVKKGAYAIPAGTVARRRK